MPFQVIVTKHGTENALGLLRRFSRKVRSAGYVSEIKDERYYKRSKSSLKRKEGALVRIKRVAEKLKLEKLGKIAPRQ
ncbi:MAG TPA: hypothetical protein VGE63_01060 [Candidatus Paceibacterota bacterium]